MVNGTKLTYQDIHPDAEIMEASYYHPEWTGIVVKVSWVVFHIHGSNPIVLEAMGEDYPFDPDVWRLKNITNVVIQARSVLETVGIS